MFYKNMNQKVITKYKMEKASASNIEVKLLFKEPHLTAKKFRFGFFFTMVLELATNWFRD